MKRLFTAVVLSVAVTFALACGGGGAPAHGPVTYQTYKGGSTHIKFLNETQMKMTWRNMSGPAVEGTYTHSGDLITIDFGEPTNTTQRIGKYRQLDDCQLAQFWVLYEDETIKEDDPKIYTKDDPRCKGR